jgi:hypothetical protein
LCAAWVHRPRQLDRHQPVDLNLGFRFDHTTGTIPDLTDDTKAQNPTGGTFGGLGKSFGSMILATPLTAADSTGKTVAKVSWAVFRPPCR